MLLKLIRWSKGYVDFSASGKFPERFINLTTRNGINVWNLKPTEKGFSGKETCNICRFLAYICDNVFYHFFNVPSIVIIIFIFHKINPFF